MKRDSNPIVYKYKKIIFKSLNSHMLTHIYNNLWELVTLKKVNDLDA